MYESKPEDMTEVEMGETFKLKIGKPDTASGEYRLSLPVGTEGTKAVDVIKVRFQIQR